MTKHVSILDAVSLVTEWLNRAITAKLIAFCTNAILSSGLTTKSDPFDYTVIVGTHSVNGNVRRKAYGKLVAILKKFLLKSMPYLTYLEGDFLQVEDYTSIKLSFTSPKQVRDFENGNISDIEAVYRDASDLARSIKEVKVWTRYVKYLNFQFRYNLIPFKATLSHRLDFDPLEVMNAQAILDPEERKKFRIRNSIKYNILISPSIWYLRATSSAIELISIDEILKNESGNFTENQIKDAKARFATLCAKPEEWLSTNYYGSSRTTEYKMERIFLHLKDCIKIFRTLTRKFNYGYQPYVFRAVEST